MGVIDKMPINNCTCDYCGKYFYKKPNKIKKSKHNYCSDECRINGSKEYFKGENNPMYGKKGSLSSRWKSDTEITDNGYIAIRNDKHPFKNSRGFVLKHRLIAEDNLLDNNNSVEIDGKLYLKPEYDVHHIDFNKKNNDITNLCVLDHSTHTSLHNFLKNYTKLKTGKFQSPVNNIDVETIIMQTNLFLKRR